MTIVDVTLPGAPVPKGSIDLGGESLGIAVRHPLVFVANQTTDFKIVDVSNADVPKLVASKTSSGSACDVAVKDDVAYVAGFGGELYLFRIPASFPATIQQIKVLGLPAWSSAAGDATNLAKLSTAVLWDRRDDPINSTSGTFSSASTDISALWLGSDLRNRKLLLQQYVFVPISRRFVWATRAQYGAVFGPDPE